MGVGESRPQASSNRIGRILRGLRRDDDPSLGGGARRAWRPVLGRASGIVLVASLLSGTALAQAPPKRSEARSETVAILRALPGDADGSLRIRITQGDPHALPIGGRVEYRVTSDRSGYLSLLHVDAHGVVTVIHPNAVESNQLVAGEELALPPIDVTPPIGQEELFLVATQQPASLEEIGLVAGRHGFAVVEDPDGPAMARRLSEWLQHVDGPIALARFEQRVVPRKEGPTLLRGEIIETFSSRTRSIRQPRLDLPVHFDTDSTELSATARRDLDEFGFALASKELAGERFVVGGHTDDVGDEAYNLDLSRRRAERVRAYLTERHGIAPERLIVWAYGETDPLEPGTSEEARRINRRVEFSLRR